MENKNDQTNETNPKLPSVLSNKWCNGTNGECSSIYYGVHIPCDVQIQESDEYINVFEDKIEALKLVKKYKKARFKAFSFYHEAANFAVYGFTFPNNNVDGILSSQSVPDGPPVVGEKPSLFRGPKSQDLVKLRKGIECGDLTFVEKTIWDNPRYLISVGDTPSILQEGFRYNGLHVAAKAKNHEMSELILHTVANVNFIKLLYGDDSHQDSEDRAKVLLDLYLNTPDKGLNETPLHFAVKFGALKVVEVLVSFPQCDRMLKNKFGKMPSEIICDRCENYESKLVRNKIALILEDNFYVPVLRSEDNCMPPVIGEPFSPSSPPRLNKNPIEPRLEIHAYAGPMNKEDAEKFRKVWKTPPRLQKITTSFDDVAKLKIKDSEKGLECLGRVLATEYDVGWKEYWPFLKNFVDLASHEGLEQLESYLDQRFNSEFEPTKIDVNEETKSEYSFNMNSDSPHEGSGKNSVNLNCEISPMSDLCQALQLCTINDNSFKVTAPNVKPYAFKENLRDKRTETLPEQQLLKTDPFLYVEKSCQVFANRISNDIVFLLETEYDKTKTILETQMKQLKLLISSFKDDNRFNCVNFQVVHSRLGSLISEKLKDVIKIEDNHKVVCETIENWLEICTKNFDDFSSDDESINHRQPAVQNKSTCNNKQVMCLLQCILNMLSNDSEAVCEKLATEEECMKAWSEAKVCSCVLQTKVSRKSLNIKRTSSLKLFDKSANFKINGMDSICKRLSFGDDDVDHNNSIEKNPIMDIEECDDNSCDEYYTPPSSPTQLEICESDDEDEFDDSRMPENEIFIEGDIPTKVDYAVYNALHYRNNNLNPKDYPYTYRWYHTVSLYSDNEKESWSNINYGRCTIGSPTQTSTPTKHNSQCFTSFTPPTQWLRVTGANSPRASLTSFKNNVSFNL